MRDLEGSRFTDGEDRSVILAESEVFIGFWKIFDRVRFRGGLLGRQGVVLATVLRPFWRTVRVWRDGGRTG